MSVPTADADRTAGISPEEYRHALRRHAAGVVIVTLNGRHGPVGFTATSLASLSLAPPLVSFAVAAAASSFPAMQESDSVLVHVLGDHQRELARRFATSGIDRFAEPTNWSPLATGEPMLHGTPTWLRCTVEQRIPLGDHVLVVAVVQQAHVCTTVAPLLYHDGTYHRLGTLDGEPLRRETEQPPDCVTGDAGYPCQDGGCRTGSTTALLSPSDGPTAADR
ncbi:flavin reductase family protein [Micromonospora sp. NPDC048999]|uniref:flavin reductase family protein n=1 Tax=Micromonospora sp. NPDC048999 TaxID=3155391 RepID=UPI0033EBE28C